MSMTWADYEERYGETRAELEDDPYHDQLCPKCDHRTLDRTSYDSGCRYGPIPEPPSEEWQCRNCDYVEGY